jgi:ribonucleoside-triphosphate reductase (thioredoxin)
MHKIESNKPINFLEEISNFIFVSKYSRYCDKLQRRETWDEATSRLENMHLKKFKHLPKEDLDKIKWAFNMVKEKKVVPSMRSLQFGGTAIEKHNTRLFNCSMTYVNCIRTFSEIHYMLLSGCGVGIGLFKEYLDRLPDLVDASDKTGSVITYTVEDSIEGWADSIESLLNCYFRNNAYTGRKIIFDYSKIRKEGSQISIGGKAPGYKGLKNAHSKIKKLLDHIIENKHQKRIKSINVYDIIMHLADSVLAGGLRRSALAVLFEPDDNEMMNAKTYFPIIRKKGTWEFDEDKNKWCGRVENDGAIYDVCLSNDEYNLLKEKHQVSWTHLFPHRARSNNSISLAKDNISYDDFKRVMERTKQFGEPGFVFSKKYAVYNPCFEAVAIPITDDGVCGFQMCNLTSINGRQVKSIDDFKKAVEASAIIGTLQASYTNFKYLSNASKKLTEEEALLGCSITGIMDSPEILLNPDNQKNMALYAVQVNKEWAKKIGINQAARVTLCKPEGSSSLVLGCASGIHPHHAKPNYFRRVQCNKLDPIYKFFKKHNPHMCEESVWSENKTDDVITFPIIVPENCISKQDISAIKHLEIIKSTQQNWVDYGRTESNKKDLTHSVSCTVLVKDNEWDEVIKYLYDNRQYFAAVSLLPATGDKLFAQTPMEAVLTEEDKKKWDNIIKNYKSVDFTQLIEKDDETQLQQEFSCVGNQCELKF